MTTNLVRARRFARHVVFGPDRLLGGSSLVIPAGQTVRLPGAGAPLDFSGFNTLSVWALISGFGGGDALALRLNTVDPESPTLAVLGSDLGAMDLLTVTADGEVALTTNLISRYGSQSLTLEVDGAAGGWGGQNGAVFPNLYTNVAKAAVDDSSYLKLGSGQAGVYVGRFQPARDPGSLGPFALRLRAQDTSTGGTHKVGVTITDALNTTLWNGTNAQNFPAGGFAPLDYAVTFGSPPSSWTGLNLAIGGGLNIPPVDGEQQVSLARFDLGAGGGLAALTSIPFFLNVFEWVNSGAGDVSVSAMVAELTNA